MRKIVIEKISADEILENLEGLAETLHATVNDDAAVGFVLPFTIQDSLIFWHEKVYPAVKCSSHVLFAALAEGKVAGTVQLIAELPPNQPHRCEVSKLLIHPDYRKRGIAKALMGALEVEARVREKTLITLDTRTGDKAELLYASLGYQPAGIIPNFALNPDGSAFHPTTYMYKEL